MSHKDGSCTLVTNVWVEEPAGYHPFDFNRRKSGGFKAYSLGEVKKYRQAIK